MPQATFIREISAICGQWIAGPACVVNFIHSGLASLRAAFALVAAGARRILKIVLVVFGVPTVCPGDPAHPGDTPADRMPHIPARAQRQHGRFPATVRVSLGAMVGMGLLLPSTLSAAEIIRRGFDIPAGDADITLKQFAAQSGEQLLYSPDDVSGIRTHAVHGNFTSIVALEQMLKGASLKARQDEKTKAIAITVIAAPRPRPSSTPPLTASSPSRQPEKPSEVRPKTMKSKNPFKLLTGWLAFALASAAHGQVPDSGNGDPGQTTGIVTGRVKNIATGNYLENARIVVKNTGQTVFSNPDGTYTLSNVPTGPLVLQVLYTGLDTEEVSLSVPVGQAVVRNIELTNRNRYGSGNLVTLDPFMVITSKVTEGESLAINEQRYAANIKDVVSADAFGDIMQGNVSDFLEMMPGVHISGSGPSIRGLPGDMTVVEIDGAQTANAASLGTNRGFQTLQVSMNNVSRIEVTKVPTPASGADSIGGSVNMVSKSAFERSKAQLNFRAFLTANGDLLELKKTPYPFESRNWNYLPSFDFDYTLPITKDLGIVVTGLHSVAFQQQNIATRGYRTDAAVGASPSKPYLQQFQLQEAPRRRWRDSMSVRVDYRPLPALVVSLSAQTSYYRDNTRNITRTWTTGTALAPTIATGTPLTFDETSTRGASGRGNVSLTGVTNEIMGVTTAINNRWRFDNGLWRVDASLSHSDSRSWRRALGYGHWSSMTSNMNAKMPVRVSFEGINEVGPARIRVFDNNNQEVDTNDLNNYRLLSANENLIGDVLETIQTGDVNIRRSLRLFRVPAAIQVGAKQRIQNRERLIRTVNHAYNGINGDLSPAPFLSPIFGTEDNHYGYGKFAVPSVRIAATEYGKNPALFTPTAAQAVANRISEITNSEEIKETVSAWYAQGEAIFFKSRLRVLGGVRYERTEGEGIGPLNEPSAVWQRAPNGDFVRNAAGQRVRKPEAGAAGSLEEVEVTRRERGMRASRVYDNYFPSLHFTLNARENVVLRASYAATYGRPNFTEVVPNTTITENDPAVNPLTPGTISIRNSGLKPWTADNYDFSASYYTKQGGVFSAGVFRKEIKNFFGAVTRVAALEDLRALDLDPQYEGWTISTKFNSGDAKVEGMELSAQQKLDGFTPWGKYFRVYANWTRLLTNGDRDANFTTFQPTSINGGFTFSRTAFSFRVNWIHRGERRGGRQTGLGPDAYAYTQPRTQVDVNADYKVSRRLALFLNLRDIFNAPLGRNLIYGSETPEYAKASSAGNEQGVLIAAGVKGTF